MLAELNCGGEAGVDPKGGVVAPKFLEVLPGKPNAGGGGGVAVEPKGSIVVPSVFEVLLVGPKGGGVLAVEPNDGD